MSAFRSKLFTYKYQKHKKIQASLCMKRGRGGMLTSTKLVFLFISSLTLIVS